MGTTRSLQEGINCHVSMHSSSQSTGSRGEGVLPYKSDGDARRNFRGLNLLIGHT